MLGSWKSGPSYKFFHLNNIICRYLIILYLTYFIIKYNARVLSSLRIKNAYQISISCAFLLYQISYLPATRCQLSLINIQHGKLSTSQGLIKLFPLVLGKLGLGKSWNLNNQTILILREQFIFKETWNSLQIVYGALTHWQTMHTIKTKIIHFMWCHHF